MAARRAVMVAALEEVMTDSGFLNFKRAFSKPAAPVSSSATPPDNGTAGAAADAVTTSSTAVATAGTPEAAAVASAVPAFGAGVTGGGQLLKLGSGLNSQAAGSPAMQSCSSSESLSSLDSDYDWPQLDYAAIPEPKAATGNDQMPLAAPTATSAPAGPPVLLPVSLQHQLLTAADVIAANGGRELRLADLAAVLERDPVYCRSTQLYSLYALAAAEVDGVSMSHQTQHPCQADLGGCFDMP